MLSWRCDCCGSDRYGVPALKRALAVSGPVLLFCSWDCYELQRDAAHLERDAVAASA